MTAKKVEEYVRPGRLRSADEFQAHWMRHGANLGLSESIRGAEGPLGKDATLFGKRVDNRFATLPMEGWDADSGGCPTDLTLRRWRRFGQSGAGLVWGGEAFAVEEEGRANPNQLCLGPESAKALESLRSALLDGAAETSGRSLQAAMDGRVLGLQLTHSGRWARPGGALAPLVPAPSFLDDRFPDGVKVLTDGELERVGEAFVASAHLAWGAGFDFVDIKCCHGYLLNEMLGGKRRDGSYAGRAGAQLLIDRIVEEVQSECEGLGLGVRISLGDAPPFAPGEGGIGEPSRRGERSDGLGFDMLDCDGDAWADRSLSFLRHMEKLGIEAVSVSLGCPYTTPHLLRPAAYPPSDGYLPPEDPLAGVARHLQATRRVKEECPGLLVVGSGYSYLQEWLTAVAEFELDKGSVDFVGLGRMVLSYPTFARDELEGRPLERKAICRTFSDCTTAPRNHMVSGCYPLDPFYKERPEAQRVREIKRTTGVPGSG